MKNTIRKLLSDMDLLESTQRIRARVAPTEFQKEQKQLLHRRMKFYSRFLNEGDLCFDIGANVGNRVEVFLKMNLQIVAVEPQISCIAILKKRFGNNITIIDKALGSRSGEAKIHVSAASTLSTLSCDWIDKVKRNRFSEYEWEGEYTVEVITLQELLERFGVPAFCKIDVEGFEYEVLKGLQQPIKTISLEFAIPESLDLIIQCIELLAKLGYDQFNYSSEESMILGLESWKKKSDMILEIENFKSKAISWGDIYAKIA